VLSGGVATNVKMNQRIHEMDEIGRSSSPNMGDGGCGTGLAMHLSNRAASAGLADVYLGPSTPPRSARRSTRRTRV
jgi:carbamoyltransferase